MNFVKPEQVALREVWQREDSDFTPWLAENLDYLDDLGLGELTLLDTEVEVPGVGRRLDILAETASEERIAIENQYNTADHDHLTRGLSYAVGLNASALVVIAESHNSEFRAVAEYLNRGAEMLGKEGIHIFLVSIRVEKIDQYMIPRFEVVEEPNTWRAEIAASPTGKKISEAAELRYESRIKFWTEYLSYLREQTESELFKRSKPNPQTGIYTTAGIAEYPRISFSQALQETTCCPGIWIDTKNRETNDAILSHLKNNAPEIEAALGYEIKWYQNPRYRGRGLEGRKTEECGWKTPTEIRENNLQAAIDDMEQFIEQITPHLIEGFEKNTTNS